MSNVRRAAYSTSNEKTHNMIHDDCSQQRVTLHSLTSTARPWRLSTARKICFYSPNAAGGHFTRFVKRCRLQPSSWLTFGTRFQTSGPRVRHRLGHDDRLPLPSRSVDCRHACRSGMRRPTGLGRVSSSRVLCLSIALHINLYLSYQFLILPHRYRLALNFVRILAGYAALFIHSLSAVAIDLLFC